MQYVLGCITESYVVFILAIGILILVNKTDELTKMTRSLLRAISITVVVLVIADYIESIFAALPYENMPRYIFSWIGYSLRPVVAMFFFRILTQSDKRTRWAYLLSILNSLIYFTTFVEATHTWAFYFNAENNFIRGPLAFSCHILGGVYIVATLFVVYKDFTEKKKHSAAALLFCAVATAIAIFLESISSSKLSILNETFLVACLFFFLFLHTRAKKEEVDEKEMLLSDQRAAMKLSQLQPQFIYKTLETIEGMASKNPKRTEQTIEYLLRYLKSQMEATDLTNPITFEDELERTKAYIAMEKARLPNLKVEYEIEVSDFFVPALTLQQIVENAIRHGVEGQRDAHVTIKTFASETGYTIIVQDNGKGFKGEEELEQQHQGARFGIENVRDRLERMVDGKLTYVTLPDAGTTAMISIPVDFE